MRILTLLARHGTDKYKGVEDVDLFFERQLPLVQRELVIIDNALSEGYEDTAGQNRILIGGSNAQREFSSWESGLAYMAPRLGDFDLVHLATEAFNTLYTRYLDRISSDMLGMILRRGAALGHIDYYNEPIMAFGRRSQAWLRSSFLFLPPAEVKMLGSLVTVADGSAIFTHDPAVPFRSDAPLSPNYRQFLLDWLTGDGTGQGVHWHSRFVLCEETLPWFEAKVLSIVNEHMLSVRLRAQGCAMVDATWLAGRLEELKQTGQCLGSIPSWRTQLVAKPDCPVPSTLLFGSLVEHQSSEDAFSERPILVDYQGQGERTTQPYVYQPELSLNDFEGAVTSLAKRVPNRIHRGWFNHKEPDVVAEIVKGLAPFVPMEEFSIDSHALTTYFRAADYAARYPGYYRGNLVEKSLEHFITVQLLQPNIRDVFLDIASEDSPLPDIVSRLFKSTSYAQDIMYPPGIGGGRIGGDACEMPVPDGFATKIALTCSLEHFEGNSDSRLFYEIARVLKPGGRVAVVPLYIFNRPATLTDPRYSASVEVPFDADGEIYCAEGYCNRHGRFYSPQTLVDRILRPVKKLRFTIYRITGREYVEGETYATFALLGEKV